MGIGGQNVGVMLHQTSIRNGEMGMNKEIAVQIEELKAKARESLKEFKELEKQIYNLQVENMDIGFGSILTRTSTSPFYEEEHDEYLVILSKDSKVLFVNTSYWIPDYEFNSLKEAKEFIMQEVGYKWKLEMIKLNLFIKKEK